MSQTASRRPGRPTRGVERIDDYDGSRMAKERAKALLLAVVGEDSITTQLDHLGICRTRFVKLRDRGLQALVAALEPRVGGRRAAEPSAEEIAERRFNDEIALLRWELEAAQLREDVATLLPHCAADRPRGARKQR